MRTSNAPCVSAPSQIRAQRRSCCVGCNARGAKERVGGVDLDSMSERELERLHAGLLRLAALPEVELRALVGSLLAGTQDD
jgi:hypothetical protein